MSSNECCCSTRNNFCLRKWNFNHLSINDLRKIILIIWKIFNVMLVLFCCFIQSNRWACDDGTVKCNHLWPFTWSSHSLLFSWFHESASKIMKWPKCLWEIFIVGSPCQDILHSPFDDGFKSNRLFSSMEKCTQCWRIFSRIEIISCESTKTNSIVHQWLRLCSYYDNQFSIENTTWRFDEWLSDGPRSLFNISTSLADSTIDQTQRSVYAASISNE